MPKFSSFYDDTNIPYASKEEKAKLVAGAIVFTITAVGEREGKFKGQTQRQWVVTCDIPKVGERLITMSKSANRDRHMETIAQNLPCEDVQLAKVGAQKDVWAFVPAGVTATADKKSTASRRTVNRR